jgi:hypothetical protein
MKGLVQLQEELTRKGITPLLISADPPSRNQRFREALTLPAAFVLLSDEDHAVADRYGVPISRKHPAAKNYRDGFIQPAALVHQGEEERYRWITRPRLTNLYGAAKRPTAAEILESL